MSTATLTKAVRALLQDVEGGFNIEYTDPTNKTPRRLTAKEEASQARVTINVVEVDGVHRTLPHVRHIAEETKGLDKVRDNDVSGDVWGLARLSLLSLALPFLH